MALQAVGCSAIGPNVVTLLSVCAYVLQVSFSVSVSLGRAARMNVSETESLQERFVVLRRS